MNWLRFLGSVTRFIASTDLNIVSYCFGIHYGFSNVHFIVKFLAFLLDRLNNIMLLTRC